MTPFMLPPLVNTCSLPGGPSPQSMLHQFAESLGNAIDAKDHCTRNHSEEVAVIGQIIALTMGFSPAQADTVHVAGHLHDIGKIGVPDDVLGKPGPLTDMEWALVRKHPEAGAEIIRPCTPLNALGGVADITHQHHERSDGSGYPRGLSGHEICPGPRILAVADSLSAMMQDRPYRRGMSFDQAVAELASERSRYDPYVLDAMVESATMLRDNMETLRQITTSEGSSSALAELDTPPLGELAAG